MEINNVHRCLTQNYVFSNCVHVGLPSVGLLMAIDSSTTVNQDKL